MGAGILANPVKLPAAFSPPKLEVRASAGLAAVASLPARSV